MTNRLSITKPLLLLVENCVKYKITKECQTFRSQTYETYHNNKYHSGITYQQVQHAHFGSKFSPIVVSHKKILKISTNYYIFSYKISVFSIFLVNQAVEKNYF